MKDRKINNIINDLINITDTVIIYNKPDTNFIIEKNNINKKIETKEFINNNKIINKNININIQKEYKKEILKFIKILNNKLNHCNFDNLNNNIKSLEVVKKNLSIYGRGILAGYNVKTNKLLICRKTQSKNLPHELLHMASRKIISDKYCCCGFDITNLKKYKKHGIFINEGYTELLNEKYFYESNCYIINKTYAKLLEIIIGKEIMEKMYFNSDLVGLINELMKYNNSLEDVIKFIINTDTIHENLFRLSIIKRIKLRNAFIKTNDFLIKTYYEKVKSYTKNEEDINISMELFISVIKTIKLDIGFNDKYIKDVDRYTEKKLVNN